MKYKIIVPTGYMGSGSSAMTDLVSEYAGYEAKKGSFEYVFLHCPNGLFDLEDKLLVGNTALRSDEAIRSFQKEMQKLYSKKYYWVGHYREIIGPQFMQAVEKLVDQLVMYRSDFYWYVQEDTSAKMVVQLIIKRLVEAISLHHIKMKKPLLYPQVWLSYPTEAEFYQAAHDFIYQILNAIGHQDGHIILDQLLLPHNLYRVDRYFDEDLYAFVIDRDPRDVFIINKYIWTAQNAVVPYETDPLRFCEQYKRIRASEKKTDSTKVHRFHFEDLIYDYEKSVERLEKILGLTEADHIRPRTSFKPEISINNTQLFLNPKYQAEAQIIERELKEYLYPFPFARQSDEKQVF